MNESNLQTILSIAQNYLVSTTNTFDRPARITSRNNKVGWYDSAGLQRRQVRRSCRHSCTVGNQ